MAHTFINIESIWILMEKDKCWILFTSHHICPNIYKHQKNFESEEKDACPQVKWPRVVPKTSHCIFYSVYVDLPNNN